MLLCVNGERSLLLAGPTSDDDDDDDDDVPRIRRSVFSLRDFSISSRFHQT